jgi:uncharacterized membrane protein YeaQ/YmgE (transglycosylase-associated protein family)
LVPSFKNLRLSVHTKRNEQTDGEGKRSVVFVTETGQTRRIKMGNIIWFLLVGLVAGVLAKAIMPGTSKEPSGWILTIVLGIVGAVVGGFIASAIGIGGGLITQIIVATVGAILVIALLRLLTGGRRAA